MKLQMLEKMSKNFDTSKDFDAVMAYYDTLEISKNLKGKRLLEVGTSAGTVTRYLAPISDSLDIVEGSATGIRRTKKLIGNADGKINYFHELWENFKPKEKYTDIIFIRGLEHVEHPSKLLSKMKKWLVKGGRIHIIVPYSHAFHRRIMVARGELPNIYALRERDYQVGHVRIYNMTGLKKDIKKSGLKLINSKGFFVKPLSTSKMGEITMDPHHPFVIACHTAGKLFPHLGTQLYAVCKK